MLKWLYRGRTILGKIIQRAGRKGYYLQIAVPRDLRSIFRTATLVRKLSNKKEESLILKDYLENDLKKRAQADPLKELPTFLSKQIEEYKIEKNAAAPFGDSVKRIGELVV